MAFDWLKKKKAKPGVDDEQQQGHPTEVQEKHTENDDVETMVDPLQAVHPNNPEAKETISPPEAQEGPFPPEKPKSGGLFKKLKQGLTKTRQILTTDIDELFSAKKQIDDDMLDELEELLITSDIGVQTAMDLMQTITRQAGNIEGPEALKDTLKQEILSLLKGVRPANQSRQTAKPHVVMVVGVNGVGKTTTLGKLAARATHDGQSVLISAADTFRAAASEQLAIWAQRAGAELVRHKENADPAAVAYDSMEAAMARDIDTVFVDTAGRLHTKVNLMEELKKIKRTIAKVIPGAPHDILLVLDATTGQNALSQAKLFHEALGVTCLALTKLDGTAKGGIVISICQSLNIPLNYIGVGESIEDLQNFDPEQFANALF